MTRSQTHAATAASARRVTAGCDSAPHRLPLADGKVLLASARNLGIPQRIIAAGSVQLSDGTAMPTDLDETVPGALEDAVDQVPGPGGDCGPEAVGTPTWGRLGQRGFGSRT